MTNPRFTMKQTPLSLVAPIAVAVVVLAVPGCAPMGDEPTDPDPDVSAPTASARHLPNDADRQAVLATVQSIFDALAAGDGETLRRVMHPQVLMHSVERSADGARSISMSTLEDLIARVEGSDAVLTERMFDPEVRVSGDLAMVWTPYDFYVGDQLSHCGADGLLLARNPQTEAWQIISLSWTRLQPPECELHPEGPPG